MKNVPHLRCQGIIRVWIPALTLRLGSGQARWANLFRAPGTGWMRDGSIDWITHSKRGKNERRNQRGNGGLNRMRSGTCSAARLAEGERRPRGEAKKRTTRVKRWHPGRKFARMSVSEAHCTFVKVAEPDSAWQAPETTEVSIKFLASGSTVPARTIEPSFPLSPRNSRCLPDCVPVT